MTTEKYKLIQSLIEMQKKFMGLEREDGVTVQDYFAPDNNHPLQNYTKESSEIAEKLAALAHAEKGSKR